MTPTGAFALVSGATTATGSFKGNAHAHQNVGGVQGFWSPVTYPLVGVRLTSDASH